MKPKLNKWVKLTLDSTRRKSVWKPSTCLAKKNSFELNFPICTISFSGLVFPNVMYQFVDLADRAVVTDL